MSKLHILILDINIRYQIYVICLVACRREPISQGIDTKHSLVIN